MSVKDRPLSDRLREKYDFLVDELNPSYFVNELYAAKVLCEEDKEQLTELANKRRKQATHFVDILMKKSEASIQIFLEVLISQVDKQPYIYEELFPQDTCAVALRTPNLSLHFVGRKKELEDVLERVTSCKFVCVVGPAGIGKTELAKRACELYLQRSKGQRKYWWVGLGQTVKTFSEAADLYNYIRNAIISQSVGFKPIHDHKGSDEEILGRLDELFEPDSILLIDSCENCHNNKLNRAIHRFLTKLLSSPRDIKVIATSQRTLTVPLPNCSDANYRLSPLQVFDAVDIIAVQSSLQSRSFEYDRELLKRLAHQCSCFPLALAIVRSLLQEYEPDELCERLEESFKAKFSILSPTFEEANIGDLPPLSEALQACFDLLKSRNPTAYQVLLALSVIPQTFDAKARDAICRGLGETRGEDKGKRHVLLQPVKEHCFLQGSVLLDKTSGLEMHSLIREFASEVRRKSYSNPGELDERAKCNFIKHFSIRLQEIGARYRESPIQSFRKFDCHMESFALFLRVLTDETWKSVIELPEMMDCIYKTFVSSSVGLLFVYRIPSKEHIRALESLLDLIRSNRAVFEEIAEVRILFDLGKALKTTWDEQHTKRTLAYFGETRELLRSMHKSDRSIRFLEADCLKAWGRVLGRMAGHKDGANEQRQEALEKLEQSSKLFHDILKDTEKQQSDVESSKLDNTDKTSIKRKLASCLKEQAEIRMWLEGPAQVCGLFQKVLEYRLDIDGENHVSTAQALLSLGKNYRLQSTPKNTRSKHRRQTLLNESETFLKRALSIISACGIEQGPIAGKIYYQLGRVYKDMSRRSVSSRFRGEALAIDCFEKGIAILQGYGQRLDLGLLYFNLGRARADQGNFDAAEEAYKLTEDIYVGVGTGDFGILYWIWAETCRKQRNYAEELILLQKSKEHLTEDWRIRCAKERIDELAHLLTLA